MLPESYRYYRLDGAGHLHDAEWFEATGDQEAIMQVEIRHPDVLCEIWQGTRLIAKLLPKDCDPDDFEAQDAVAQRLRATALRMTWGLEPSR